MKQGNQGGEMTAFIKRRKKASTLSPHPLGVKPEANMLVEEFGENSNNLARKDGLGGFSKTFPIL